MGDIRANDHNVSFNVYKGSIYMGYFDKTPIVFPDTGWYSFYTDDPIEQDSFIRYFGCYEIYRDTFLTDIDIYETMIWDKKKKKYKTGVWMCDGCIMDGQLIGYYYRPKRLRWEGKYKEGTEIWYKEYDENGNLILYRKRSFAGKEKVVYDKRWEYWRKKDKEKLNSQGAEYTP
ncbi:MAG: hypothetical protein MJZ33_04595 [Paludibacteraceae bacterium]|nr:hypothetical protein [Paludibacteraceae bacterium]